MAEEKNKAIDPRSIANYIIKYSQLRGNDITNLSVQKLLYFSHAIYLKRYSVPLVSGYFEAWELGPVHRVIYDALKVYGSEPISQLITKTDPLVGGCEEVEMPKMVFVTDHLDEIMRSLGRLKAGQLVDLSHAPNGPWHYIWNKSKTDVVLGNRITDDVTEKYFAYMKVSVGEHSNSGAINESTPIAGD